MKNKIGNVPVASFPLGEDRLLYREEKKKKRLCSLAPFVIFWAVLIYQIQLQ